MSPETMGTVGTWGPILIMVLIFYFLLYIFTNKLIINFIRNVS